MATLQGLLLIESVYIFLLGLLNALLSLFLLCLVECSFLEFFKFIIKSAFFSVFHNEGIMKARVRIVHMAR